MLLASERVAVEFGTCGTGQAEFPGEGGVQRLLPSVEF